MPPARFLREFWQKRPLLIRGAFASFGDPLAPNDLAGPRLRTVGARRASSCTRRSAIAGRCAPAPSLQPTSRGCRSATGPCSSRTSTSGMPMSRALLGALRVPAATGASTTSWSATPSTADRSARMSINYDVFLLQGLGRRRWRISTDPACAEGIARRCRHQAAAHVRSRRTNGRSSPATCCICRRACRITASRSANA